MSPADSLLEELRALAARVLNDEPITGADIRRLAVVAEQLDAHIHEDGVLPEAWATAVASKARGGK